MSVDKGQTYVLTDRAGFTHTVTVDHVAEYLFDDGAIENAIVDGNGLSGRSAPTAWIDPV